MTIETLIFFFYYKVTFLPSPTLNFMLTLTLTLDVNIFIINRPDVAGAVLVSFPDSVQGTESGAATAVGW